MAQSKNINGNKGSQREPSANRDQTSGNPRGEKEASKSNRRGEQGNRSSQTNPERKDVDRVSGQESMIRGNKVRQSNQSTQSNQGSRGGNLGSNG